VQGLELGSRVQGYIVYDSGFEAQILGLRA